MKIISRWTVTAAVSLAVLAGAATTALGDSIVNEVFICELKEGKTLADLNAVIEDFKKMVGGLKGGDKYTARLLTPIAAANMNQIVWVGEMPDSASMGTLTDDYRTSKAGQEQDKKFQSVITCESRSLWLASTVK